jgi:hypothetical protein
MEKKKELVENETTRNLNRAQMANEEETKPGPQSKVFKNRQVK